MIFDEFKSELSFLLRNRNDADAVDTTRVERWVNSGYVYMCHPSVHEFREMQDITTVTLVTGTSDYTFTDTATVFLIAVRFVTYLQSTTDVNTANKRKVRPIANTAYERKTLTTGIPTQYSRYGDILQLAQIPGSTESGHLLRVGRWLEPTKMTDGADVTVIPSYFDRPLLKFAQAFAEEDLGMRDLSMLTMKHATALTNNAESEFQMEGEDTGFQVEIEGANQPVMGP